MVQQRAAHVELEDQRHQVKELSVSKKQLQSQVAELKDRLEVELMAKNEEISMSLVDMHWAALLNVFLDVRRELQMRMQEFEITSSASSTIHSGEHDNMS